MMQQTISFYDIEYGVKNGKIYFIDKKKIGELFYGVKIYPDFGFEILEESLIDSLFHYPDKIDLAEKLELDKTYYMVEENPWQIIGIISLHKGFTYIDCAEHTDRVIIHSAFPDEECNILS